MYTSEAQVMGYSQHIRCRAREFGDNLFGIYMSYSDFPMTSIILLKHLVSHLGRLVQFGSPLVNL
jgi:hypothetical protein